ncbi:MAG: hypothetical protein ACE141_01130 [Bryobacteraceae bacterium]
MADFRKVLLTLIAGALLFTAVASAQNPLNPYSCNATAVPTLARSEGHAERMGDVLLTCTGTVPTAGILANIRLRLTANITSNPFDKNRTKTEAMLIKDENDNLNWYNGWWGYGSPANLQNVWQAGRISDDEIEWTGVWLAAPGSPGAQTIRLTNVRGDVDQRGDFATIYASINIVSPTSVPVDNNLLVVADTRPGLIFSVDDVDYKNCVDPEDDFVLNFKEGYASAFLPIGDANSTNLVPGGGYLNESGWNPGSLVGGTLTNLSDIGQADQGTRLMARIKDVPDGVDLTVPGQVTTSSGLVACVVPDSDSSGAGGNYDCSEDYEVGSDGLVVYEVVSITNTSYSTQETVAIPVDVDFDIPGPLGDATANGNLAPLSTVHTMSSTAPEPRFKDVSSDKAAFSIDACRTILLFPFVTNQAGFDTGIAISNTSMDPLDTVNQDGACSLYYYGNTSGAAGPATQTTPEIPAGGHFVMGLSGGGGVYDYNGGFTACSSGNCVAPLFQGYIFAICDFQFAHGYAFISDFGARLLAQGYLALIVPDRGEGDRAPDFAGLNAAPNDGEQLGN